MMVFKNTKLGELTKGMNVDRKENLGCYNINNSDKRGGTTKRDGESTTRKAGGKTRECMFWKPREVRGPRKRIHQRHQMLCSEH